jgi:hypothetical protein
MGSDIYKKIDAIFAHELDSRPAWADELLDEVKKLTMAVEKNEQKQVRRDRKFYRFLREFRASMYADTQKRHYPKINYKGRVLGVDFNGLLYDTKTSRVLPTKEAFRVYDYLYTKEHLEIFY